MTAAALAGYEERFPEIKWREPVRISWPDDVAWGYGCRVCIALFGMEGKDVPNLPQDPDVVRRHIVEDHTRGG